MRLPITRRAAFGLGLVSPSSPIVQQLAAAINRQEGAMKNNNPGNLVYVGQPGAIGADSRGFAIFPTLAAGQAAEANQIALDINRGSCASGAPLATLTDLINCWSTTDQAAYVANVSQWTGIDPNTVLNSVGAGTVSVDETSTGFDLTDPATLALISGLGLLAFLALRR